MTFKNPEMASERSDSEVNFINVPELPSTAHVDNAKVDYQNIEQQIKDRIDEEVKKLRKRLEDELGKKQAEDKWRRLKSEKEQDALHIIESWLNDIYDGRYGLGQLVYTREYDQSRLARVIPIINPIAGHGQVDEVSKNGYIEGHDIIPRQPEKDASRFSRSTLELV